MEQRRYASRPRTRRPGAGRPRNQARAGDGPVDAEIVGAAAHLFAHQGVAATTMAQIAGQVGLEVTSMYYYFANKRAILERIVVDVNLVPLAIAEAVRSEFDDPARRLHAFIRRDAAALCEFPFDFNEIHRLARGDDGTFARYWSDRGRLLAAVEAFVGDGVECGDLRPVDPELTAVTILANDEAVQNWYRPGSGPPATRFDPAAIGTFVADLALRGLLADPQRLAAVSSDTAPAGAG